MGLSHAVILEILALSHRDHEGLLVRRHRVARADDGNVLREDRGGEGRRKNCQNKRKQLFHKTQLSFI